MFSWFLQRITNRSFPVNDPVEPLYKHIDWSNSVIGGSYALKQFTGDNGWEPNDIDILTSHQTTEQFNQSCCDLEKNANLKFVKSTKRKGNNIVTVDFGGGKIDISFDEFEDHEMFHELIKESKTYNWNNNKIQIVHVQPPEGRSLQSVLAETTDCPSCVSYHIESYKPRTICGYESGEVVNTKIFHVPQKGLQLLMTGKGKISDICKQRKQKYEEREYKYE